MKTVVLLCCVVFIWKANNIVEKCFSREDIHTVTFGNTRSENFMPVDILNLPGLYIIMLKHFPFSYWHVEDRK